MSPRCELSRRVALQLGLAGVALGGVGCRGALEALGLGDDLPDRFAPPRGEAVDSFHHLVQKTSFGPRPGDVERARRLGKVAWVDEQLAPEAIDDAACDLRAELVDVAWMEAGALLEIEPAEVEEQLARHAVLRAVYSKRQLLEVVVEALGDHFHVAIGKGLCRQLAPLHDRDVVRKHALGSFRALLEASALSPAMLVYLDGKDNRRGGDAPGERPNENYARELLELHTLGVHGGYTQEDVMQAARCLTGFVLSEGRAGDRNRFSPGAVDFAPELHDDGEKIVLGQRIPAGGGREDLGRLLDVLCDHPATGRHVAERLARAFVSDAPPAELVEGAASTFRATRGDLRATLRTILLSDALEEARGEKLKRPFRFVVSLLRALGARAEVGAPTLAWLARMGHAPFAWPTPDGYPARAEPWLATLLARAKGAFALAHGQQEDARIDLDRLARAAGGPEGVLCHLLGRLPDAAERAALEGRALPAQVAILASGPELQRY